MKPSKRPMTNDKQCSENLVGILDLCPHYHILVLGFVFSVKTGQQNLGCRIIPSEVTTCIRRKQKVWQIKMPDFAMAEEREFNFTLLKRACPRLRGSESSLPLAYGANSRNPGQFS